MNTTTQSSDHADHEYDVAIVGAGLAGLSASVAAISAGASRVLLVAGHGLGGRASTDDRDGFQLNRGAHALYRKGPGMAVLERLDVRPRGSTPPVRKTMGLRDGRVHPFPVSPSGMASDGLLGVRSKMRLSRFLLSMLRADPEDQSTCSTAEWLASAGLPDDAAAVMRALIRLTTYTADLDRLSADVAIRQFQLGRPGVLYLDGGWAQLVGALFSIAERGGVHIDRTTSVSRVEPLPDGGFELCLGDARRLLASSVVVAAGPIAACQALLPITPYAWTEAMELAPPVEASSLDMALAAPSTHAIVLGVDEPLYFSVHSPPAALAPPGGAVAHAMRYDAPGDDTTAAETRRQLEALADSAGAKVTSSRYLHRMTVVGLTPTAALGGQRGRPSVAVDDVPGLFVAGDWVGPEGFLADGALCSGERAGRDAAIVAEARSNRVRG